LTYVFAADGMGLSCLRQVGDKFQTFLTGKILSKSEAVEFGNHKQIDICEQLSTQWSFFSADNVIQFSFSHRHPLWVDYRKWRCDDSPATQV